MAAGRAVGLHRYFARRSLAALAIFVAAFTSQALSRYFLDYLSIVAAFVVVHEVIAQPTSQTERVRMIATLATASLIILAFVSAVAVTCIAVRSDPISRSRSFGRTMSWRFGCVMLTRRRLVPRLATGCIPPSSAPTRRTRPTGLRPCSTVTATRDG